jgi:nucleoside-diphosphate-sugar epimerase
MLNYEQIQERLASRPRAWLVTGAAGFIGSHLTQALLKLDQPVVGLTIELKSAVFHRCLSNHRSVDEE